MPTFKNPDVGEDVHRTVIEICLVRNCPAAMAEFGDKPDLNFCFSDQAHASSGNETEMYVLT